MQLHNFNSGPSILPQEVLDQAAHAIHNFNDTGLSILRDRTSHNTFCCSSRRSKNNCKKINGNW